MPALICGSFAYDSIMVFPGRFADQILPNQIHVLNVSFLVPEMRREFGGCAGNIAYNLGMIGGNGHAMGAVGLLGPLRMSYSRGVSTVRFVSELISELITESMSS